MPWSIAWLVGMGPVDDHERSGRDPDPDHHHTRARLGHLGRLRQPATAHEDGGSQPGGDIAEQQRNLLEEPEDAEQLGDQDQQREADHDLGEACQRPHPGRREQGSQVVGA